jgi:hypothetical protein
MAMGILKKAGLVEIGSDAGKLVRLSVRGLAAQQHAQNLIAEVENRWVRRLGKPAVQRVREVLEKFAGDAHEGSSLLFEGSNLIRKTGAPRRRRRRYCLTSPWCFIVVATRMEADLANWVQDRIVAACGSRNERRGMR